MLPCAVETEAMGTLAAFLSDLGVDVTEKNLDKNDDNDDDDNDDDDNDDDDNDDDDEGFIEDEAEEAEEAEED